MLGNGIFGPHLLSKIVNDNDGKGNMGPKEHLAQGQKDMGGCRNGALQITNAKTQQIVQHPIGNGNVK
jgi:hypothetical protein